MTQDNIEVLSFENKQVLNTEVIAPIGQAQTAQLSKDKFIFIASEGFAEYYESFDGTMTAEVWVESMNYIKAEIVNRFEISANTAKDYMTNINDTLKLRNPAIVKPASTKADAVRKAEKKAENDAKLAEYAHVSVENLTDTLVELAPKTDKDSILKFKEISSIVKSKNDAILKASEEQSKKDIAKFKEEYRKDVKDILNNEFEFAQYLHANLAKYRKDFEKAK